MQKNKEKSMMKNTNAEILESFGKILMKDVRDWVISNFERDLSGVSKQAPKFFENLTAEQKQDIRTLVYETVDSTIHHFLFMLEQEADDDTFDLIYKEDKNHYVSLRDISDGLGGEPYTEDGWIEKFSKYPTLNFPTYEDKSTPEENLAVLFSESPSAAKREFVKLLNNNQKYEELKTKAHALSPEILRSLIEMTLSQSSFHEKECKELLEILDHQEK